MSGTRLLITIRKKVAQVDIGFMQIKAIHILLPLGPVLHKIWQSGVITRLLAQQI